MAFCTLCGEYKSVIHKHVCTLYRYRWLMRLGNRDTETWEEAYAITPEALAEKLSEENYDEDPCDPSWVDDLIEIDGHGVFHVSAEARVHFNAVFERDNDKAE